MKLQITMVALLAMLTLAACGDPYHYSKTGKGALIGGAVGADAGALVGYANGSPVTGAVAGAGLGALGGAAIGAGLEANDRRDRNNFDHYSDPYYQHGYAGYRHHHKHHHGDHDEDEDDDDDD